MKSNLINKIIDKKEYVIMFFAVVIFLVFIVFVFWGIDPTEQEIPNYESLVENNLDEYNKSINEANNISKEMLENNQLNEITKNDNLIKDSFHIQRNKNPFVKSF